MKKIKHSKFKNTGLIFELLVRRIASDTMNNCDTGAVQLIRLQQVNEKRREIVAKLSQAKSGNANRG